MDLTKLSKNELLEKCKELGFIKCKSKNKNELIDIITKLMNNNNNNIHENINDNKYTFIEVCAGGGGLSSGLIKAGFTPILLNDNNNDCCKTLLHNHPNTNVICDSMDKIDFSKIGRAHV